MKSLIHIILLSLFGAAAARAEIAITPQADCLCAGAPRQAKPPSHLA